MSEHLANVTWKRATGDFVYETYDRSHTIRFPGGQTVTGSDAADFMGKKELANPEEMLAAALSSCHMLTFLALAAKSRLVVDRYEDSAVATLSKNIKGALCVTRIELRPKTVFSGQVPPPEKVKELHEKAHKHCFIANSLACEMVVNPG